MTLNHEAFEAAKAALHKTYIISDGPLRAAIEAYLAALPGGPITVTVNWTETPSVGEQMDMPVAGEAKITQAELAGMFPDGIPIVATKIMFPEQSHPLTTSEVRTVLVALSQPHPADERVMEALPDDDEPKSFRDLAKAAIMDLRRYADDEVAHRRHVSADAYEERFRLLASLSTAPATVNDPKPKVNETCISNGEPCVWDGEDFAPATADGWREITEDDRPPLDTDIIMGCWETLPKPHWATEIGHYGSKRGGWVHGRMTHWLPLDHLPAAPTATGGR